MANLRLAFGHVDMWLKLITTPSLIHSAAEYQLGCTFQATCLRALWLSKSCFLRAFSARVNLSHFTATSAENFLFSMTQVTCHHYRLFEVGLFSLQFRPFPHVVCKRRHLKSTRYNYTDTDSHRHRVKSLHRCPYC